MGVGTQPEDVMEEVVEKDRSRFVQDEEAVVGDAEGEGEVVRRGESC